MIFITYPLAFCCVVLPVVLTLRVLTLLDHIRDGKARLKSGKKPGKGGKKSRKDGLLLKIQEI
ncbi:hypothetical protein [Marinobacter alexandrii]|uniref:hypothetical protein n=1 Tax=Marinobacter alexandrii TaxID=2570351 RepID=UPI0032993DC6